MTSTLRPVPTQEAPFSEIEARETRGLTSRLILNYVERERGAAAVAEVLERAGLADLETELRDENFWFPYRYKIALFDAAEAVLEDPTIARHVGSAGIELNVGAGVKRALRALGSPRLVYSNIVRACGKFTASHRMDLLELEADRARIRYVDITGIGYHRHDCEYNVGLLACIPELFGYPPARISHPVCALRGGDACIYEARWHGGAEHPGRRMAAATLAATALVGGAAVLAPATLPFAAALGLAATGAGVTALLGERRRRWRMLESKVEQQAEVSERLAASLQDLVSELRLDEVLAKITSNAQSTVGGKEFALLVEEESVMRCQSTSGLPASSMEAVEAWAASAGTPFEGPVVLDDVSMVPELAALPAHPEIPLGSLCAAPLLYHGRSVGVLLAFSPTVEAFLPDDVDALQSYAAQAAIALANARLYEAQQALASRDPLTALLNHREFHETVARELERCRRYGGALSVVLFDLDGFKLVNDVSGHAEGDRVLRATAHALTSAGRAADLAFRIGGDELALVLPDTGPDEAALVAGRAAIEVAALDARTTMSYGIASWPDDGPSKDTLLAAADSQLYAMKGTREVAILAQRGAPPQLRALGFDRQRERLAILTRTSAKLSMLDDEHEIAQVVVDEIVRSFGYYVAVVLRLDPQGETLRLVACAGELSQWLGGEEEQWTQSIHEGINGRAARTGEPCLIEDTRPDPDFVAFDAPLEARSALSLPIRVAGEVWGVLDLESTEIAAFDENDLLLFTMAATMIGATVRRARLADQREDTFMTALGVLCDALETKDSYTAAHAREVADLCERVGARLGLRGEELRTLSYAALLHDIGKIGVRSETLAKPGPLEPHEFEEIKRHTVIGAQMLARIPTFAGVQALVRSAHERWDGRGYPDALAGEEIPLGSRIIGACDAFHAMTSDRPYREALSLGAAMAELRRGAGSQFDALVVDALIEEIGGGMDAA